MRTRYRHPRGRLWLALGLLTIGAARAANYRLVLDPESVIVYRASTPLETWEGRAPLHRLEGSFDDADPAGTLELRVTLEPDAFRSGIAVRDINAQRTVFETDTYPLITFTLTSAATAQPLLPGRTQEASVTGTLAMHGVERTLTLPVTVERAEAALSATGRFEVRLSDYGMRRPSFLFVTVDDPVQVEFALRAEAVPD